MCGDLALMSELVAPVRGGHAPIPAMSDADVPDESAWRIAAAIACALAARRAWLRRFGRGYD